MKVFLSLTKQSEATRTFRELAQLGLPTAEARLAQTNGAAIRKIFSGSELDKLFLDKPSFLAWAGGLDGMAQRMTSGQVSSFRSTIDAASVVFIHSAVDAAVSDLCEVSAVHAPADWDPWLANKRVSLSRTRGESYESLRASELNMALETLKRESLLKRVDRIFALCQPSANLELIHGYLFDRDRLEILDKIRHEIIHGAGISTSIQNVDEALEFLVRTGLHLFALINWKYDIKLDPALAFKLASDVA